MGASTSVAGGTIEKAAAYDRFQKEFAADVVKSDALSAADAQALLSKMRAAIAPPDLPEKNAETDGAAAKLQAMQRGKKARAEMMAGGDTLEGIWVAFCSFGARKGEVIKPGGQHMTSAHFNKFCKENKLYDKKFTPTDADMMFTGYKSPSKKLTFTQFEDALGKVAEKKGADLTALVAGVLAAGGGPASSGTKAQDVKFANPDNFTGTAAKGGIDKGVDGGMAALMNRSKQADVRGAVDTLNVL